MYDLIIKNGKILNGTGSPYFLADIAIKDGKIARIAKGLSGAKREINAAGLTVTPGFVDSHSHSDRSILDFPDQREKIEQGITTVVAGQCGDSMAPLHRDTDPDTAPIVREFGKATDVFRTMGSFLQIAQKVPQGANIVSFVGHQNLRSAVMGTENRDPTAEELERMKEFLREGIRKGAIGVSFGLIYAPSCYAETEELIELAKVAGEHHALVSAHIRDEGDQLVRSVEEFIRVIRESGARGVLSHHKSMYTENWGKVQHTLRMIEKANEEGMEIYCDAYPYCASHTSLSARFLPKEYRTGGTAGMVAHLSDLETRRKIEKEVRGKYGDDLSWVLISDCAAHPEYEGKRISELAEEYGLEQYDMAYRILLECGCEGSGCYFSMCEEDVEAVLAYPRTMICTDSDIAKGNEVYHPRLRGSFPRVLGRYVRERGVTSLAEMIRKMTSMPAAVYGFARKGILAEGFDADLCVFDAERIIDRSDFGDCHKRAEGLNYVILNGQVVVEDAVYQGIRAGRVLLRQEDGIF